jgi:hypothetical protein
VKTYVHLWYLAEFLEWEISDTKVGEKLKTYFTFGNIFSRKLCHLWGNLEKEVVQSSRSQMTVIRFVRFAWWVTNTRCFSTATLSCTFFVVALYVHVSRVCISQDNKKAVYCYVTMRRVYETIVAVKKQYVLSYFCVCVTHHKQHDFRKKVIEHKMCFDFLSTTFIWNVSLSRNNIVRYCHKCENVFVQSTRHCCWILMKLEFLDRVY